MSVIKLLSYYIPLYFALTLLARSVPKKSDLVLVLARSDGMFSDNSKYVYFSLAEDPRIDLRFLTYSPAIKRYLEGQGIRTETYPSLSGVLACLRARVTIGSGYHGFRGLLGHLISHSHRIQLWHGAGIKSVALDAPALARRRRRPFYDSMLKYSGRFPIFSRMYFPAKAVMERRASTFYYEEAALNGFLRNDLLLGKSFGGREFLESDLGCAALIESARTAGRRLILFAPTWRSHSRADIGLRIPLDLGELERLLAESDALLVLKLHKNMKDRLDLSACPHIIEYSRERDIYPYLRRFDLMVSDFSSIVTDFALTGHPIILYNPDYEISLAEARFAQVDFEALMGERCTTMDDLLDKIGHFLRQPLSTPRTYPRLPEFHAFRDAESGARLLRAVRKDIDLAVEADRSFRSSDH